MTDYFQDNPHGQRIVDGQCCMVCQREFGAVVGHPLFCEECVKQQDDAGDAPYWDAAAGCVAFLEDSQ